MSSTGSCFKIAYYTKMYESFKTSSTIISTRSRLAYQFFSDNVVWCSIGDTCIDMSSCTNLSSYCLLVYLDSSVNENYYCVKNEHRTIFFSWRCFSFESYDYAFTKSVHDLTQYCSGLPDNQWLNNLTVLYQDNNLPRLEQVIQSPISFIRIYFRYGHQYYI